MPYILFGVEGVLFCMEFFVLFIFLAFKRLNGDPKYLNEKKKQENFNIQEYKSLCQILHIRNLEKAHVRIRFSFFPGSSVLQILNYFHNSHLRPFVSLQHQGKSQGFLSNSESTKCTVFSQQPGGQQPQQLISNNQRNRPSLSGIIPINP